MKKIYLFTAALLATVLGLLSPAQRLLAQTVWNGTADISWYDASQTSFDISTPEQLAGVAQLVNNNTTSFNGMTLNLTADIWLNSTGDSTNNWVPIGGSATATSESPNSGNTFRGAFNGHGHAIYNLYCDKSGYFHAGLFGGIQYPCTIDSLVVMNPVLKSRGMMGAIAGFCRASGSIYVRHCLVVNARVQGTGNNNMGCIIGATYNNSSTTYVQNCGATGSVSGNYPGGIFGNGEHTNTTNCYFAGTITVTGGDSNCGTISAHGGTHTNCYAYANITNVSTGTAGTAVTQAYMQSSAIINDLGPAFMMDNGVNNGYPIMSYMSGVDPSEAVICTGESVTLTAFGFDSYSWNTGESTASITVSPTTTTTYTVNCTANGTTHAYNVTVTVLPNAVVTASVAAGSDGQTHATVTPDQATIGCGTTGTVQFTVTPETNYRVSRVTLNGNEIYGDNFGEGTVTITVDPNGTLGDVKIYLSNTYTITTLLQTDEGTPLTLSNLVQPYGTNGVNTVNAGDDAHYTFQNTARWHLTSAEVDGSYVSDNYYDFNNIHENHTIVATYTDSCGIASFPFFEDFESASNSQMPECYDRIVAGSSGTLNAYDYSYYSHSGSKTMRFYSTSNNDEIYLILPKVLDTVNHPLSSLMVTFYANVSNLANTITVGTMTDPSDATTFTPSGTVSNTTTYTYQEHIVYLGNAAHGEYIAIKGLIGSSFYTIYLDDITVGLAPTCSPVQNLALSDVYGTNATLSWNPNSVGELSQYNIYVHDLTNGTEANYSTTETTYTVMGLSESTSYQFGVFTSCVDGSSSDTLFVSAVTPCNSPVTLTIGEGSGTSSYFPTHTYYKYSMSQQIFTAAEFEYTPQDFTTLSFQYTSSSSYTRNLDIYVAHIPDSLTLANGWIVPNSTNNLDFHQIHSGNVAFNNAGTGHWYDIPLDSAFRYNGTDNVLLTVLDHTGSYPGTANFGTHSSASNMSRYYYSDNGGPFDYTNMTQSGTASSTENNVRFSYCDSRSCLPPNTLTASNMDENSADINWVVAGSESSWEIEYMAAGDSAWTSFGTVSAHPATLNTLTSNTGYSVRVRALCGNSETSVWSNTLSFRTSCGAISQLPVTERFDTYISDNGSDYVPCWQRLDNSSNNSHHVYYNSSYNHSSSSGGCLDFHYSPSCYTMAISPMISIPANNIMVEFWARKNTGTGSGTFEVGVMTDPSDASTFESVSTIEFDANNTWEQKTVYLAGYTGTGQYVAFRSLNATAYSYMLDDVTFDYIPLCMPPMNVAASDPTLDGATITWSGDAGIYAVYAISGTDTTYFTAYDTTVTLTGLQPSTSYSVLARSLCGGDSSVLSNMATFTTQCGAITVTAAMPWTENFEGYSGDGAQSFICWDTPVTYTAENGTAPFVYCGHAPSCHSGANSAEFKGNMNILVLPEFTNDIHDLRLSFWATSTSPSNGNVEIGVITNVADTSTFEFVAIADRPSDRGPGGATAGSFGNYMGPFDFNGVTAASGRIALRYTNTSASASWNLDDFTVSLIPDCPSPVKNSVTATSITDNSAVISWTDNDATHTAWTVYYKPSTDDNDSWLTMPATSDSVTLGNLSNTTQYDVYVITNCGTPSDIVDATNTIHFTTSQTPEGLPFTATFPASGEWMLNNSTAVNYWMTGVIDTTTGTNGLFVTHNGTTPGYSANSFSAVVAEKLLTIGTAGEIYVDFDLLCGGESTYDYLKMFLAPGSQTYSAGTSDQSWSSYSYSNYAYNFSDYLSQTGNTSAFYKINLTHSNTLHITAVISNPNPTPDATSTAKLVFGWRNDGSVTSEQPGAVISNLTVGVISCPKPANLSASNIGMTSADLSWTSTGTETSWLVEYKEVNSTSWIPVPVSGTASTTLTGLTAGTNYEVRVQALCDGGDSSLYVTTSFATPLCGLADQCAYIFNLSDSYGDGWAGSIDVQQNGVTVANVTLNNGSSATETVNLCDNATTTLVWNYGDTWDSESSFTVTDPAGNEIFATTGTPSGTLYTFTTDCSATPQGPCNAPGNWSYSNLSQTGATVSWTAGGTETQWNLQCKSITDADWSASIPTSAPTYTFSGLTENTIYMVRVQAVCSATSTSDWSMTGTFTTLAQGQETCHAPTNLTASDLTASSVTLDWSQEGTPDSWTVSYKQSSATSWATVNTTTHPYTLTDLAEDSEYEVYVVANCGGLVSGESNHVTFTTTGIGDFVLDNTILYPNPTTGEFRVENAKFRIQSVEVYDIFGKLMGSVEVNDNSVTLDATRYASGVYFVRILTDNGMATKRIVKK